MQSIRISTEPHNKVDPVVPVQMKIYQSNTYRKDLSWLRFEDKPRVQERQQVLDQESYLPVSVTWLTYPSST